MPVPVCTNHPPPRSSRLIEQVTTTPNIEQRNSAFRATPPPTSLSPYIFISQVSKPSSRAQESKPVLQTSIKVNARLSGDVSPRIARPSRQRRWLRPAYAQTQYVCMTSNAWKNINRHAADRTTYASASSTECHQGAVGTSCTACNWHRSL